MGHKVIESKLFQAEAVVSPSAFEEMERRTLNSYQGTVPGSDMKVKPGSKLNMSKLSGDMNFIRGHAKDNKLPFYCFLWTFWCTWRSLQKTNHTDQYLLFDSPHPLEQTLLSSELYVHCFLKELSQTKTAHIIKKYKYLDSLSHDHIFYHLPVLSVSCKYIIDIVLYKTHLNIIGTKVYSYYPLF